MKEADNSCCYCRHTISLEALNGPMLISHTGAHILHDVRLKDVKNPCGFCLRSGTLGCIIYLKTSGKVTTIDMVASQCPHLRKISLKSASQFTMKLPCTNHPVQCPLCLPKSAAIWKYNLCAHINSSHRTANSDLYQALFNISDKEVILMKGLFLKVPRQGKKSAPKRPGLIISNAHSSRYTVTR